MSSYEIKAVVPKNRLYVILKGFYSDEQAKIAADTVLRELDKLSAGFDVITDITQFKPTTPAGVAEIARVQKKYVQKGRGRIIRVVGEQVLTKLQFARTSKEAGMDYEMVATLQEAEHLLDNPKPQA